LNNNKRKKQLKRKKSLDLKSQEDGHLTLFGKEVLQDIVNGAALLGAGGGGPKKMASQILDTMSDEQQVEVASLDNVGDNDWVVVAAFIGIT